MTETERFQYPAFPAYALVSGQIHQIPNERAYDRFVQELTLDNESAVWYASIEAAEAAGGTDS